MIFLITFSHSSYVAATAVSVCFPSSIQSLQQHNHTIKTNKVDIWYVCISQVNPFVFSPGVNRKKEKQITYDELLSKFWIVHPAPKINI